MVLSFYSRFYNNVTEIDGFKSKWFVEHTAMERIEANLTALQEFSRNYYLRSSKKVGCKVQDMHMDRVILK